MAVVKDSCEGRALTYTGVDETGEVRNCAKCMEDVYIDPEEDSVEHLE